MTTTEIQRNNMTCSEISRQDQERLSQIKISRTDQIRWKSGLAEKDNERTNQGSENLSAAASWSLCKSHVITRYVLILKPGFWVIKAQRDVVSGSPLCDLTFIFRLRGSRLRALRLTTIKETFPCEEWVRVRARIVVDITTNVSVDTTKNDISSSCVL